MLTPYTPPTTANRSTTAASEPRRVRCSTATVSVVCHVNLQRLQSAARTRRQCCETYPTTRAAALDSSTNS
jgi:hypothetical protein